MVAAVTIEAAPGGVHANPREAQPLEIHRRFRPRERETGIGRELPGEHGLAVAFHRDGLIPVD